MNSSYFILKIERCYQQGKYVGIVQVSLHQAHWLVELAHVSAIYYIVTTIVYVMHLSFADSQTLCVCHIYKYTQTDRSTHKQRLSEL